MTSTENQERLGWLVDMLDEALMTASGFSTIASATDDVVFALRVALEDHGVDDPYAAIRESLFRLENQES